MCPEATLCPEDAVISRPRPLQAEADPATVTSRVITVPLAQWALRLRRTDTSGPWRVLCVAFWICLELGRQRGILPPFQGVTPHRRSPLLPRRRPRPLPNLQVSRRPRTRIVDHAPPSPSVLRVEMEGMPAYVREKVVPAPRPLFPHKHAHHPRPNLQ